eukprot:8909946-Alexandrium_andersonii.AAC.1
MLVGRGTEAVDVLPPHHRPAPHHGPHLPRVRPPALLPWFRVPRRSTWPHGSRECREEEPTAGKGRPPSRVNAPHALVVLPKA